MPATTCPRKIFLIAGEHSGDALGAKLMSALKKRAKHPLEFAGVGGDNMQELGFKSLFPLDEVAVMGPLAILRRLPHIVRRVYETVDAAIKTKPDIVVIIDSPEFTHPIAKRIRKRAPHIPIIDYVSPSIWAWRSGRARKMKPYVDHVLALLPFEPEAHERHGGPPCTYVGHPLSERLEWINTRDIDDFKIRHGLAQDTPILTVLPGSRASELRRLMKPFRETIERLHAGGHTFQIVIPAVSHLREIIIEQTSAWPARVHIVDTEEDKFAAFRASRAALAASGTVTLELALAGTPAVVAYKVDPVAAQLRFLLNVPSVVLANLVLGENVYPEYLQEDCTPEKLDNALVELLNDTDDRRRQLDGLARIPGRMKFKGASPSDHAAKIVLEHLTRTVQKTMI